MLSPLLKPTMSNLNIHSKENNQVQTTTQITIVKIQFK